MGKCKKLTRNTSLKCVTGRGYLVQQIHVLPHFLFSITVAWLWLCKNIQVQIFVQFIPYDLLSFDSNIAQVSIVRALTPRKLRTRTSHRKIRITDICEISCASHNCRFWSFLQLVKQFGCRRSYRNGSRWGHMFIKALYNFAPKQNAGSLLTPVSDKFFILVNMLR